MSGIFSALGIGVSVTIIAIGGGFSGPGPSITNPPTAADLWRVGEKIKEGEIINYSLTAIGPHSSLNEAKVSIDFAKDIGNDWKVNFIINNATIHKEGSILLSKQQLTLDGPVNEKFNLYFEPIDSSILAIRDIAREPKYLVVGAPWDIILVGLSSIPIKVTAKETIETGAGTFDTFILSYKIGSKISKIWLAHDMPMPIKAEVYNSEGQLQYRYELTGKK
ncbi:MAG: hypothetical protein WA421_01035 [Nitrososphaeraceae archaeon]|jgi:hypothetical protein